MSKLTLESGENKESKLIVYDKLVGINAIEVLTINDKYDDVNQLFLTKPQAIQLINHLKTQFGI